MAKSLVIVESPGKISKIQGFLGSGYTVKASVGHCYEINKSNSAIDIKNDFETQYSVIKGKKKVVDELKRLAKTADTIYVATDADREGEAIGWHIVERAINKGDRKKVKRIKFQEITKSAVLNAVNNPTEMDEDLFHAQQARSIIDRLVGYKVSPFLWRYVASKTSAGRVQSAGLRLIVERQQEIDDFKPEEYWTIDGEFITPKKSKFKANYVPKKKIRSKKENDKHVDLINAAKQWIIDKIESTRKSRHPYPVFQTSTMQQFCSSVYGWPAKKTMATAQKIYEKGLCLLPNEMIILPNGSIVKIKDAYKYDEVIGFTKFNCTNQQLKTKEEKILDYQKLHYSGNIKFIRTLDGQEISCTPDHKFLVYRNRNIKWVKASCLTVDDFILCAKKINVDDTKRNNPKHILDFIKQLPKKDLDKILVKIKDTNLANNIIKEHKKEISESCYYKYKRNSKFPLVWLLEKNINKDCIIHFHWQSPRSKPEMISVEGFCYFLGLCLGDGHISKNKIPFYKYTAPNKVVWSKIISKLRKDENQFKFNFNANSVQFSGQILRKLCICFGGKEGSKHKYINIHPYISSLNKKLIFNFIAGLFDSDGCINLKQKLQILYTTTSQDMAKQLNILFRILGYSTNIHHNKCNFSNYAIKLTKDSYNQFLYDINKYLIIKKNTVENILKKSHHRISNVRNKHNLPIIDLIENMRKQINLTKQFLSKKLFNNSHSYWNYLRKTTNRNRHSYLSIEMVKKISDILYDETGLVSNSEMLDNMVNSDYYFAQIKIIDDVQYNGYVYDITTSSENFIANTFFSHNCTYHRTDSVNISKEAVAGVRKLISSQYGNKYVPSKPNYYKSKNKSAQEAHEGIRPTHLDYTLDKARELSNDEYRLYEAIYKRFVACQMSNALFDHTKVTIVSDNKLLFTATGQILAFDGFLKVYNYSSSKETMLPELNEKDEVKLNSVDSKQHFTKPPPQYTEATLVKTLEEKGIGRPSTYASIIETLKRRGYTNIENKIFVPTDLGKRVCEFLKEAFPELMKYDYTARIEDELDEIANNKKGWKCVIHTFWDELEKYLKSSKEVGKELKKKNVTDHTCPKCGQYKLVKRFGRYGEFYGCAGYSEQECDGTFQIGENGEPVEKVKKEKKYLKGHKCDCGAKLVIRASKKTGNEFAGCEKFPKCRNMYTLEGEKIEFKKKTWKK